MARTSFDGPVYGARGALIAPYKDTVALSQTNLETYEILVPANEDWYVDRVRAYSETAGTAAATVRVLDDGVSILSSPITLLSAGDAAGVLSANPTRIVAASVVTCDVTSGATTAPADWTITVEGWRRFVGAPRGTAPPLS